MCFHFTIKLRVHFLLGLPIFHIGCHLLCQNKSKRCSLVHSRFYLLVTANSAKRLGSCESRVCPSYFQFSAKDDPESIKHESATFSNKIVYEKCSESSLANLSHQTFHSI